MSQVENVSNAVPEAQVTAPATMVVVASGVTRDSILAGLKSDSSLASKTEEESYTHATDLNKEQWANVINASGIFKAWKGSVEGDALHITRAPCASVVLREPHTGDATALAGIPEFEVADDTYVETRESSTRLEREMTLKAFTESGIHAALSGGAEGISLGLGSDFSWSNQEDNSLTGSTSTSTVHGFYNFPRVIVHLEPDSLTLSPQCERFFEKHKNDCYNDTAKDQVLEKFFNRFGAMIPQRVTLGGRLCTTQEVQDVEEAKISQLKKDIKRQLTATVTGPGAGIDSGIKSNKAAEQTAHIADGSHSTRMTLETQGGNGLLASSVTDWTASVGSYRYWRPIQQDRPQDILTFLAQVSEGSLAHTTIQELSQHLSHRQLVNVDDQIFGILEIRAETGMSTTAWNKKLQLAQRTENVTNSGSDYEYQIPVRVHVSQPKIVNRFSAAVEGTQYFHGNRVRATIHKYAISCGRDQMEQNLSGTVKVFTNFSPKHTGEKSTKPPIICNVKMEIWLEPFMIWGDNLSNVEEQSSSTNVSLYWPDIEVNRTFRWKGAVKKSWQVRRPPQADPIPTVSALQEVEATKVEVEKLVSQNVRKTSNLFSKR